VLRAIREGRLKPEHEATALARLYQELTPADFSKDLLQHVPDRSLVLPMDGIDWCDWGRPWRVTETLARLKRQPLFPTDYHNYVLLPETVANESPL
jgi:mannose-1-phosphate guanylyltransferase